VLVLAPLLGFLPMSALAAMLLVVAWNMSHAEHFFASIRTAPRSDTTVQLTCFALTVAFDMVVAISVGVVLAALLFMRRMAEVSGARLVGDNAHPAAQIEVPQGVLIYEVAGPLFFGATHKAVSALETVGRHIKVIILDLEDVPAMDATALVNLSSTFDRLNAGRVAVILAQVQDQPERAIRKAGWTFSEGRLELVGSLPQAVERSKAILIERRRARTLPG
jgi:SulP family sulfate permease